MGLNSHERFENHMDVSAPETVGDAERAENVFEDAYDDLFEERLAHASEYVESGYAEDNNKDYDKTNTQDDEDHNRKSSTSAKSDSAEAHLGIDRDRNNPDDPTLNDREELSGDIVFEGMTEENPQYGEGGGKQYFIRGFGDMKQDGRMTKIDEEKLEYTGPLMENTGTTAEIEKQEYKYNATVDTSPLTDEEKSEWDQLDEETRDEQGLSRVMPDLESQIVEDRKNPWSDQENSRGSFSPDAYSNPRELQAGETYYQLRPVDAKYDSPYVTDEKTVDACRNEKGEVDVTKLLQKLQVPSSSVREYTLTQYVYEHSEESNKVRN